MILNNKKSAFTLAEVLITLLIIGVVASIIIPNLLNDSQDAEFKIAWKKAYGTIVQTYITAKQEDPSIFDGYNCYDDSGKNIFIVLKNSMGVVKECNGHTFGNCWANNGVNPDSSIPAWCPFYTLSSQNNSGAFVARDGSFWLQYGNSSTVSCPIMAVDINGNKGPNQWGKDVLSFGVFNGIIYFNSCTYTNSAREYLK